jgi:hypothetical protein
MNKIFLVRQYNSFIEFHQHLFFIEYNLLHSDIDNHDCFYSFEDIEDTDATDNYSYDSSVENINEEENEIDRLCLDLIDFIRSSNLYKTNINRLLKLVPFSERKGLTIGKCIYVCLS